MRPICQLFLWHTAGLHLGKLAELENRCRFKPAFTSRLHNSVFLLARESGVVGKEGIPRSSQEGACVVERRERCTGILSIHSFF